MSCLINGVTSLARLHLTVLRPDGLMLQVLRRMWNNRMSRPTFSEEKPVIFRLAGRLGTVRAGMAGLKLSIQDTFHKTRHSSERRVQAVTSGWAKQLPGLETNLGSV